MPIYEYHCPKCGYRFEQLQKITDNVLVICPKCGQNSLKKIISQTSFQLKGSGWYVTDFKDKKSKPEEKKLDVNNKADNKTDKKIDTKVHNKTENKPAKTVKQSGDKK